MLSRLLAESNVFSAFLPSSVRFSLRDSFLALDVARWRKLFFLLRT